MPNHMSRVKLLSDCFAAADYIDNHPLGHKGDWHHFTGKTRAIEIRKFILEGAAFYHVRCQGKGDQNVEINIILDIHRTPKKWDTQHICEL